MFAAVAVDVFKPGLSGTVRLGQAPEEWYRRAKASVSKFEDLRMRVAKIANKQERERLGTWIGSPGVDGTPAYRAASVASDLADVERFTPPAYQDYQIERRRKRITELEEMNRDLSTMVSTAEQSYGRLPEPVIVQTLVSQAEPGIDWKLPVLVGGGALVTALVISLLFGGRG
jgi:hypothetical protein